MVLGNEALLKCIIPSLEGDFVSVVSWEDSEGVQHPANHNEGNRNVTMLLLLLWRRWR